MNKSGEINRLRIYLSSTDKHETGNCYETIVLKAKENGLAGATVLKGILGYGASSVIHSYKFWELTEKLPVVVELIDEKEKIEQFFKIIHPMLDNLPYGCLVSSEKVDVLLYKAGEKKNVY